MKYSNPQIPEGINTSKTHPLQEFAVLTLGALVVLIVIVVTLGWLGGSLARYIPFEAEINIAQQYLFEDDMTADSPLQVYLHTLSDRVIQVMALPESMHIQLHYVDATTVNAFATLGGHVILFRGLLEKLPHENALVMLMAHEYAHIKHRDPIVGVGSGVAMLIAQTALLGNSPSNVLGHTGLLTTLSFSRSMESAADREALRVLQHIYGHINGAADLFHLLHAERHAAGGHEPPTFLSSHPLDATRIQAIDTFAQQQHSNQATTPLPAAFQHWLHDAVD